MEETVRNPTYNMFGPLAILLFLALFSFPASAFVPAALSASTLPVVVVVAAFWYSSSVVSFELKHPISMISWLVSALLRWPVKVGADLREIEEVKRADLML